MVAFFEDEDLRANDPVVEVKSTKGAPDGWRASGVVIFHVRQGRSQNVLTLEVPFEGAASEKEALRAAKEKARAIAGALLHSLGS